MIFNVEFAMRLTMDQTGCPKGCHASTPFVWNALKDIMKRLRGLRYNVHFVTSNLKFRLVGWRIWGTILPLSTCWRIENVNSWGRIMKTPLCRYDFLLLKNNGWIRTIHFTWSAITYLLFTTQQVLTICLLNVLAESEGVFFYYCSGCVVWTID